MNIIIPNYEILNFEAESLVISDAGISRVYSQPLIKVLRQLQVSSAMTSGELNEMLAESGLSENDAFNFLKSIIPFRVVDEVYFEKIIIVHDWEGVEGFEDFFRSELSGILEFKVFADDVVEAVKHRRCFIVVMCRSYNYESLRALYFDLVCASPQSAISVCWQMGGFFCVGQPYIPEIGNPCHFCTVDRLINDEEVRTTNKSWANVLAFCRNKHVAVPASSLTLYQKMLVIGAVIRQVRFFTKGDGVFKFQDNVLYGSFVQLSDGRIFEESNSHWYMCDCLRSEK